MDSETLLAMLLVLALLVVPVIAIAGLWLAIAARRRIRAVERKLSALQEADPVTADAAQGPVSPSHATSTT
jgi:hypothetical protein